jgi:hypothetical protein
LVIHTRRRNTFAFPPENICFFADKTLKSDPQKTLPRLKRKPKKM